MCGDDASSLLYTVLAMKSQTNSLNDRQADWLTHRCTDLHVHPQTGMQAICQAVMILQASTH